MYTYRLGNHKINIKMYVKTIFGMQEIYNVCLYVGMLVIFDTLVLWVITFPKCTGGAPCVLLALLLGAGDCTGDSRGLDVTGESVGVGGLRNMLAYMWFY